jgi:hypothetical protein
MDLNRYKLVLGVFAVTFFAAVIVAGRLLFQTPSTGEQSPAISRKISPTTTATFPSPSASHHAPILPNAPLTSPPTTDENTAENTALLQDLFSKMRENLQNLAELYALMGNPLNNYGVDTTNVRLYQKRIDQVQQTFNTLLRQASKLSNTATQNFLWEQYIALYVPQECNYLLLDNLHNPSLTLFEQMLTWLEDSGAPLAARQALAYNVLSPSPSPSPRQRRLQTFVEARLRLEPDQAMLLTYLELYNAMTEQDGWVTKAQFREQLDVVQSRLDPDQYFDFRYKTLNLGDANADYAGLLNDINHTAMTPKQRQVLTMRLADEIIGRLSAAAGTDVQGSGVAPANQQLLLRYLAATVQPPSLQDGLSLYQYGSQQFAIALLQNKERASEMLYQQLVNSQSLAEQVALSLAMPYTDGKLQQRIRQQTQLQQQLREAAQQANTSPEQRSFIESALISLTLQSPATDASEHSFDMPALSTDATDTPLNDTSNNVPDTAAPVP